VFLREKKLKIFIISQANIYHYVIIISKDLTSMPRANIIFLILFIMLSATATSSAQEKATAGTKDLNAMMAAFINTPEYRECIELFKEVYRTMRNNYYYSVEVTGFQKFMGVFNAKLYPDFKMAGSSQKFIKWRSAAYLVEALRSPEDIFSAFYPPSEAKQYATEALGQRLDLGIEGKLKPEGFFVTWIEIRSEAYEKGMRENDVVYKVDEKDLRPLTQKEAVDLLNPLEGTKVKLTYLDSANKAEKTMEVVSKTFFKQAVFLVPTDVPGVFCINLPHFNQATAEDVTRLMDEILSKDGKSIIIDLRGNPGGPPLAARELSAFFLTPHEEFAYFQKRERPKASIDVPEIASMGMSFFSFIKKAAALRNYSPGSCKGESGPSSWGIIPRGRSS
jgi:C-terminal processing protease CtpA/Prc